MSAERTGIKVAKFGGGPNATAENVIKLINIVKADPSRKVIVVSAPGRSLAHPEKVTDLLLGGNIDAVADRFLSMGQELGWEGRFDAVAEARRKLPSYGAALGEWLQANMVADRMGARFVNATELIRVNSQAQIDPESYALMQNFPLNSEGPIVIPGFLGLRNGAVVTLGRGGSDETAAAAAKGFGAEVNENWTDVDGVKAADPRIIENPKTIPELTYEEMRAMSINGANVLMADAVSHVVGSGIPTNILNTFNPDHPGTMITDSREIDPGKAVIGIASRPDMMAVQIKQHGLNDQEGVGATVFGVFRDHNVSYVLSPAGIDTMDVIVSQKGDRSLNGNRQTVLENLALSLPGAKIQTVDDLALISVVGEGIKPNSAHILASFFDTLSKHDIGLRTVDFSTVANDLVVSISKADLKRTTEALYRRFIDSKYIGK